MNSSLQVWITQLVEQLTRDLKFPGSNPAPEYKLLRETFTWILYKVPAFELPLQADIDIFHYFVIH